MALKHLCPEYGGLSWLQEILLDEEGMKLQGKQEKKALDEPKADVSRTYFIQIMLRKLG